MPPTPPDSSEEDVLGKAYDARLARRLLRYAWPYRALIASSLALLVIDGALQLVGPLLTRRVIDVAIPAGDATAILHAALLFGGTLLAQFGCTYGETVLTARLGQRVMHDLRTQLFAHLQRLPCRLLRPQPRRASRHPRDLRRRVAERAVYLRGRRRTRRRLHAPGHQHPDARGRLAARPRRLRRHPAGRDRVERLSGARARGVSRDSHPARAHQRLPAGTALGGCAWCSCSGVRATRRGVSTRSTRTTSMRTSRRSRSMRCTSRSSSS
ncbi:MAG: hypothetical protein IPK33_27440 [Gemmatimonadetes bacterium]|nr:hypothetical protein [Gemmatimonadota bacterium]